MKRLTLAELAAFELERRQSEYNRLKARVSRVIKWLEGLGVGEIDMIGSEEVARRLREALGEKAGK